MMRNRFYVFCLALMAALMVQAQELVRTEYFIDTDPGYGNAASVSTPLLGLNSIELDLDGVQPGAHLLCLRTVDSNGRWSATTMHPILVKGPDNDGTVARIEYFFDSDPGYGQGRSAENPTKGESQYALSIDGLTQGAHMLFIRATDNQGRWSEVTSKSIFVINNGRGEVSRIEYFFDTDPGFGQATAIENPQNGEANYALSIDGLSQGAHTLYLRAADDRGIWSSVIAHPLYVCGPTTGIAALEYFFDDNDPGEGQATQVTLPENPLEQFVFSADASALAEGNHTLNVRAKGTDGIWRLISNRIFAVTTSVPGDSEPYAVLSDSSKVLTFYYDDQKTARGGMSVGPFTSYYYDVEAEEYKVDGRGWDKTVTSVVFDESFANCTTLTSTAYWFFGCSNLTSITNIEYLKTDNVTDMSNMFSNCSGLTSLNVTNFKTDNVTSMHAMFEGCSGLTSLDVTGFKTDNVMNMAFMFNGCRGLSSLDVTNFKTDNVTDMNHMFSVCSGLTALDVTNFKTDNVTDMNGMFAVCSGLTALDLTNFKTDNVMNMTLMFDGCSGLTSLDVTNFKTDNVTNMRYMFSGCSGLTSLDVTNFKTDNVTSMRGMFKLCGGLTSLDLTNFKTDNVTDMSEMFSNCSGLTSLDVSSFKTDKVSEMNWMFANNLNLKTIYASSDWSTAAVENGNDMFAGCTNLVGGMGTVYDADHTDHTYAHIDGGESNPGYFTDKNAPVIADAEPYAVLTDSSTVLTFYYDDQKVARGGMSVGPFNASDYQTWYAERRSITTVVFDESFANCTTLTSTAYWFYECSNLTSITNIEFLKTDNVTNMSEMFSNCSGLTSLDVSNFKTDNVTDMSYMFEGCWNLTRLDVSGFNTEHVTNIGYMFDGCSNLTSLDVSGFKTDNVWGMYGMFAHCSNLKNLDVSRFNTANVTDMRFMFRNCSSLTSIDVSGFNTTNVTDMYGMFSGCTKLTSLDVSRFNTANVREMAYMFSLSSGLTSLDLSGFNTSNVTNMREMFEGCSNLTTIYASSDWSTAAVEYGNDMFYACTNLVGGMGTVYDENNVDHAYAHIDGGTANPGYFTDKNAPAMAEAYAVLSDNNTVLTFYYDDQKTARGGMSVGPFDYAANVSWSDQREGITRAVFDPSFADCNTLTSSALWFYQCTNMTSIEGLQYLHTDNVTDMSYMFLGCSSLTSLDVSGFNTSNVTAMRSMFANCSSLTSLDVTGFNTENVTDMRTMFSKCSGLTSLDVSHFNTANVIGMGGMFQVCTGLTTLDLSNFNTEKVYGMGWMFNECSRLTSINLSSFNTEAVGEMNQMFYGCTALTHLDLGNIVTPNVETMYGMFAECTNLVSLNISNFSKANVTNLEYMFYDCPSLAAIQAGGANLPDSIYAQVGNPNLLIYVSDESVAPSTINNVVVDGVARNIVLTDALTGYGNFNCPQAFRAEHISYRHNFQQETQPGVSRGWEGIALPFNVQTITHEHHGALHPFGTPEEGYPFWLRQLTPNGIVQAVRMIANRPYIISMPNSQAYHDEYNQSGWVTFAANDVTVPVTTTMVTALADSSIVMIPTMQRVEQATEVYAINRSQPYAGYPEGSIFVSNLREVRPFEAYTEHRSASPAPMFYPIDAWMDGGTGIDEMENELLTIDNAYNLNGQRVKTPRKGVFIVNGRKTVVK